MAVYNRFKVTGEAAVQRYRGTMLFGQAEGIPRGSRQGQRLVLTDYIPGTVDCRPMAGGARQVYEVLTKR
jgi:hypothetical protein